jgi:replicative DNA helicase
MRNQTNNLGIVPPQAVELEMAVLGAVLLEKDALESIIEILTDDSFYKDSHRVIFKAILDLFSDSEPIDMLTVTQRLRKQGNLEIAGGAFYITDLTSSVGSAANIEFHARIIQEHYIKRQVIRFSSEASKFAYQETSDAFEVLTKVETDISSITNSMNAGNVFTGYSLLENSFKRIKVASEKPDGITGIPSNFKELDKITGGWQGSDLIIIAARPAMGKTDLALNIALNASKLGFKTGLFSLEMSKEQLMDRALAIDCMIDRGKIKSGRLDPSDWLSLTKPNANTFKNFYIADEPTLSTYGLRAKCRRLKKKEGIQMIVIDYLQLMTSEVKGSTNDQVSHISRTLKLIAKELNIPVIALSQLSRAVETRGGDKRPMLSDLRDSGAIEQDADMVLFPYRPIYYGITQMSDGTDTKQLMQIDIAKHRSGSVDTVNTRYLGKYGKIVNFEDSEESLTSNKSEFNQVNKFASNGLNDFELSDRQDKTAPF